MAQVDFRGIGKTYPNGYQAISSADLTFNDGEFVVLVGPSGCGKSTLLRMVAGLEDITSGDLIIGESVANALSPRDRNIAMVFQNYALYPHMTVRDNLGFGLKHQKVQKHIIHERITEVAEMLELSSILDRKPKQLSGGQRQRVAVGRAIARQADVYLFDEPLSNLDASLRVSMRAEITRLHRRLKKTMVYVTHDQTEAMTMGDRIVVLKEGDVQQFDTPLNLYHFPANMFVAGFIGSPAMNFIDGRILSSSDGSIGFQCAHGTFALPLDKAWSTALAKDVGRSVVLGIRPEHFYESGTHRLGRYAEVELEVDFVEATGSEAMVHMRIGDVSTDRVIVRDTFADLPAIDQKLSVAIDLAHLQFFDPQTQQSLLPPEVASVASTKDAEV